MNMIFAAIVLSASLGSVLVYLNEPNFLSGFALIAIASVFCCSATIIYNRLSSLYSQKLKADAILWMLGQLLHYKSTSASLIGILSLIGRSPEISRIKSEFNSLRSNLRLGESFSTILHSMLSSNEYTKGFHFTGNIEPYAQAKRILDENEQAMRGRESVSLGSLQRNATINMFVSTMVPSFVIFAFIGQMVVSQSGYGIFVLSLLLLVFVPFGYSITTAFMARRLIAESV